MGRQTEAYKTRLTKIVKTLKKVQAIINKFKMSEGFIYRLFTNVGRSFLVGDPIIRPVFDRHIKTIDTVLRI